MSLLMFTLPNVNILLLLKDEYFENTTFSKFDHHPLFLFNTKTSKRFTRIHSPIFTLLNNFIVLTQQSILLVIFTTSRLGTDVNLDICSMVNLLTWLLDDYLAGFSFLTFNLGNRFTSFSSDQTYCHVVEHQVFSEASTSFTRLH